MTKTEKIIKYMREHDYITQLDAYNLCCATRLSGIIFDLKKRGYDIETEIAKSDTCNRFAKYYLTQDYKDYLCYKEINPKFSYHDYMKGRK